MVEMTNKPVSLEQAIESIEFLSMAIDKLTWQKGELKSLSLKLIELIQAMKVYFPKEVADQLKTVLNEETMNALMTQY